MGGAEKQFIYLARALGDAGINVHVYTFRQGKYYEAMSSITGVTPIWIKANTYATRLNGLWQELRRLQPHVIQSGQLYSGLYVGILGRLTRTISVGNMRTSIGNAQKVGGLALRLCLQLPTALLVNSNQAIQELGKSRLIAPQKLYYFPNVLDLDAFDVDLLAGRRTSVPHQNIRVTFVGRLTAVKRVDRFLDALSRAREVISNIQGIVIGDGPCRVDLQRQAESLGLFPYGVCFLGERHDVPGLLSCTDMLVLPSDHEGFSNVLLEAMAASLPIITTPAGDSTLVVQHNKTGLVVDYDAIQMANAIVRLATDKERRSLMGNAGRALVEKMYDFDRMASRACGIYEQIARQANDIQVAEMCKQYV